MALRILWKAAAAASVFLTGACATPLQAAPRQTLQDPATSAPATSALAVSPDLSAALDAYMKAAAAHRHGLSVIICVGETEAERDADRAERVVQAQIEKSVPDNADGSWFTLAYEPRWAIGTGRTATPQQAQDVHAFIRKYLTDKFGQLTSSIVRIQYGGSVKAGTIAELIAGLRASNARRAGCSHAT